MRHRAITFEQMRSPPSVAARDRILSDEELRAILFATLDVGPPFDAMIRLLVATDNVGMKLQV
jgi:hypothetical protein